MFSVYLFLIFEGNAIQSSDRFVTDKYKNDIQVKTVHIIYKSGYKGEQWGQLPPPRLQKNIIYSICNFIFEIDDDLF